MDAFLYIAEQRIKAAQEKGELDNLPGMHKPLQLQDESNIPDDLRMAYTMLRNSGYLPAEIADRKEVEKLLDLLEKQSEEHRTLRDMRRLEYVLDRIAAQRQQKSAAMCETDHYFHQILRRFQALKS